MDLYDVLDRIVDLLRQRKRLTYRLLKRQFALDDETLEDLKDELIKGQRLAADEDGEVLVWTGETEVPPVAPSQADEAEPQSLTQQDRLTQAEPPPEPPPPDAERRQLTMMFCDLADSTRLSGQLDPEDLRDVIRAYQSTSAEVIERYDGYIAQHLGDGLMVYFGWPQAHEDDAQRAVHAGLGTLEAMRELNVRLEQDRGIRLAVRIGIHTGLVVVGEIGQGARQEHLALGKTPNVASRIEGIAEPDTVAISDATYQLVRGYFVCDALGRHALKGVDEPQQVYRVMHASGAQSRLDIAATRGLTPLVGRESETAMLFDRWEQVKDGQGQVILLSGEAGIGKSRLLQVMRDHVADAPHTRLECRSSPYYQNTALYPITEMLQRTLQWHPDDTPEARLEKLEQTLSQYRMPLTESVPLLAPLLSLATPEDRYPPLALSAQRQRHKTLETIVAILLELAEQQPVLLILEDLHWTDPSTLDLLALLIDQIPTAALLILLTCRPAFQPPWGLRTYFTPITVNRLNRTQIETMAKGVAGGKTLPAEVRQRIVERTDGVPLFVEEITKAVLESGILKETDGQYELTGAVTSLSIPATLQDSLMARLDRLGTAKGMAQIGATIGREFSYELLQAVSQIDEEIVQHEMGKLVEAELLYQRGLPPQATYVFKHALIQDTAYQSLLRRTRQQTHEQIAQVLEGQFPETVDAQPELLAHHYTEAGQHEDAIRYWQRAGQCAIERSAHNEAIGHFTKGLELLKTLPETSERSRQELTLQMAFSSAMVTAKGQGSHEVRDAYERTRELCQQVSDDSQLFPVLRGLWMYYSQQGDMKTTRELAHQFLTLAERQRDPGLRAVACNALARTTYMLGDYVTTRQHSEYGVAMYDTQQHFTLGAIYGQDPGVSCLIYLAWSLWFLGYPEQALQRSQEALSLARKLAHPHTLGWALCAASWVHSYRREGHAGYELAEEAINYSIAHDMPHWHGQGKLMRGWAVAEIWPWDLAVEKMQEGIEAYGATGARKPIAGYALVAQAYGRGGQPAKGLCVIDKLLAQSEDANVQRYMAEVYRTQGDLLLQQNSSDALRAETCFHQALGIARHQQAKSLELRAATSLARLWQSQGKRQDAYDLLAPVYGWFTEGFDTADLKEAKGLLEELEA